MTPQDMEQRIVRYDDLIPCKTAFIDAHTPGSDQKENFTIIGAGVSESPDQHVHIGIPHGFNIGAAGQPPKCRNSLHSHRTAEVFFVLKGRWRFFWGRHGDAGEVVLEEGDLINLPTGIFRGFENIGTDYGMIMAVLGGDDAGGGVIWAPEVIEDAKAHGLVLGENGRLYDTKKGESLPAGIAPMPVLTEEELKAYPEPSVQVLNEKYVAAYADMMGAVTTQPALVLGETGMLRDKPGFEIRMLNHRCASPELRSYDVPTVLMPMRGDWTVFWNAEGRGHKVTLHAGDTMSMPEHVLHSAMPTGSSEASLFHIKATGDPAGATWQW